MIVRTLRAFAWLRWRILLNSFERQGARDVIERFSIASEQLLPAFAILLMVPSAIALAAAGGYSGWLLARNEPPIVVFGLLRFVLFATTAFAVIGPLMLPAGDRTNVVRLLLLPIPRGHLYLAQAMSALADPWMLLGATVLMSLPVGLAAGGAASAAAIAGAAGLALFATLVGLTVLVGNLVQLAVRDRRRGEILTLLFIVVIPMLAILPGLLHQESARRSPGVERRDPGFSNRERAAVAALPSEVYVRITRRAAEERAMPVSLLALSGAAVAVHALAFGLFARVLGSPESAGSSRPRTRRWGLHLPGLSPVTAAVAIAQLKLGLRTPRGRSTILSPIVLFVVFAAVMFRSQAPAELGFIVVESGIGLAAFTAVVSLLSIVPFAMNQFAVDRSGLTLMLLAPIDTASLLRGKAIGNALIVLIPITVCAGGSLLLFPEGAPALWICVPLAIAAIYVLAAPAAAALSAIFPKTVDMNSIGRSNAHGTAGLLGTVVVLAAGAPCLALVLLATGGLGRPVLAPVFLFVWTGVCFAASALLFRAACHLFDRRRENLMIVAGR